MEHKVLLVALGLAMPYTAAVDDKHKQTARPENAKRFTAFAYTSDDLTALGEKPKPGTTIAADPNVLPLGSFVKISGAGRYSGVYRVGDTGGKIKGNIIDVFVRSYEEAIQFGRKTVQLTVLAIPRKKPCYGCGKLEPKAMIGVDEARGSSWSAARGAIPSGRTRSGPGESDPWKSGSLAAFSRLPAFQGAPAH